ncbi:MAG: spore germination protein [Defluviitaleaceae bacterium]|nr:spore germination protein [Defluviitaleaceae bacterium]
MSDEFGGVDVNPGRFSLNDKISLRQLQALLILEIFGFGVTGLPRRVAEVGGHDGWIFVVLAAFCAIGAAWVMARVVVRFEGMSFHGIVCRVLGKLIGTLLTFVFAMRLILLAAFNLRIFGEIVRETLLPTTPFIAVFLAMLAIAAYGASKGIEARARVAEVLILVVLLPLILVFGISGREMDFSNLLPIFAGMDFSPDRLASGIGRGFFAFSGIEIILLMGPYLSRPRHLGRSMAGAIGFIGIFMVIITMATIARFGADGVVRLLWPVLRMMDTLSLPGSAIDRQGALIMTFWIISAFAIINAALFFSSLLIKDGLENINIPAKHNICIIALIPIIAAIALWPRNLAQVYELIRLNNLTLGLVFMIAIPILLLIISQIRRAAK